MLCILGDSLMSKRTSIISMCLVVLMVWLNGCSPPVMAQSTTGGEADPPPLLRRPAVLSRTAATQEKLIDAYTQDYLLK